MNILIKLNYPSGRITYKWVGRHKIEEKKSKISTGKRKLIELEIFSLVF